MLDRSLSQAKQLVVFNVAELSCGIDIEYVQEINKKCDITPVHLAPPYIKGVINLRGRILSVIDLRIKMGLQAKESQHDNRMVIVSWRGEHVAIEVDKVEDILSVDENEISGVPPNLADTIRNHLYGVYKTEETLVGMIALDVLLTCES